MKITVQNSFNECGICVAHMLINYYGLKNISKNDVLSNTDLPETGLNVQDLEDLLKKYDIQLDTYKLSYEELFEHHNHKPFIMILDYGVCLHYVVGMIKNKKLIIYNPDNSVKKYSLKEIPNRFTGIVSFSNFKKQRIKKINFTKNNILQNAFSGLSFVFILSNVLELFLGLMLSYFMTKVMNIDPKVINVDVLWKISIIFILLIAVHYLFNFTNYLIKVWYFKEIYQQGIKDLFNLFLQKNIYFYRTYNNFSILQNLGYFPKILHFFAFYSSDLLAECLIFLGTTIALLTINYWYGLITLIDITILLIVNVFIYKNNLQLLDRTWKKQVNLEKEISDFVDSSKNNKSFTIQSNLLSDIENKLLEQNNIHISFSFKNEIYHLIIEIFNQLLNYAILLMAWLIANQKIGSIFLSITIFHLNSSSITKLTNCLFEYLNIKPIYSKLLDMLANNNYLLNDKTLVINTLDSISINNVVFTKNILLMKKDITEWEYFDYFVKQKDYDGTVKINGINLSEYNALNYQKTLCFIDKDSYRTSICIKKYFELLNDDFYKRIMECVSLYKINPEETYIHSLPKELKGIFILISLLTFKNKLIFLNNVLDQINPLFYSLAKDIFIELNKSNLIVSNSVNGECLELYDNQL